MPVNFSQIARNTASVKMTGGTLGEESITVVYYPGRITDTMLSGMAQLATLESANTTDGLSGLFSLNDSLAEIIKSWDVTDEDGEMFPLEPKHLKRLPVPFKIEVLFAIMQDLRPEAMAPHLNGRG